jgi:hypothetical protein
MKLSDISKKINFNKQPKKGLIVNFPNEVVLKEIPATQIKISQLNIKQIVDEAENKRVVAFTDKLSRIVLWEGVAYDAIGQWTDTDVQARIIELYNK